MNDKPRNNGPLYMGADGRMTRQRPSHMRKNPEARKNPFEEAKQQQEQYKFSRQGRARRQTSGKIAEFELSPQGVARLTQLIKQMLNEK